MNFLTSLIVSKTCNLSGLTIVLCIFPFIHAVVMGDSTVIQLSTKHIGFVRYLILV